MPRRRDQTMQERFLRVAGGVHPPPRKRIVFPRWIVAGLLRLLVWVLLASAASVGLALLIGHFRGTDPSRSVPLGLYLGGAALCILAAVGTAGGRSTYGIGYIDQLPNDLNLRRLNALRGAYVLVGLLVIGLGILCDWLL
jgi:hypothetical protein